MNDPKAIYRCPHTDRYYDPLALRWALASHRFGAALKEYREGDDESVKAEGWRKLIAAGRSAMSLPAVDPKTGAGVTDATVYDVLTSFTRWLSGKGVTARVGPSAAPCTDCPEGR